MRLLVFANLEVLERQDFCNLSVFQKTDHLMSLYYLFFQFFFAILSLSCSTKP